MTKNNNTKLRAVWQPLHNKVKRSKCTQHKCACEWTFCECECVRAHCALTIEQRTNSMVETKSLLRNNYGIINDNQLWHELKCRAKSFCVTSFYRCRLSRPLATAELMVNTTEMNAEYLKRAVIKRPTVNKMRLQML